MTAAETLKSEPMTAALYAYFWHATLTGKDTSIETALASEQLSREAKAYLVTNEAQFCRLLGQALIDEADALEVNDLERLRRASNE